MCYDVFVINKKGMFMKFWALVGFFIMGVVMLGNSEPDILGMRIADNISKMKSTNNLKTVSASDSDVLKFANVVFNNKNQGHKKTSITAIELFRKEIANIPAHCSLTRELLSIRYRRAINENNVTINSVNTWVQYAYTECTNSAL